MNFLQRTATIAPPGYNRWLVPPAAIALHMCIGQIYGFSVFKKPLAQALGVTAPAAGDWTQPEVGLSFSIALAVLGVSAALFGKWVEKNGPRLTMVVSALCFCGGLVIAAGGVFWHQLWLLYLGYGLLGGIGLGLGYIAPVSTLVKWFPDRPGMATGLAIMGFGGGALIGAPLAEELMRHFAGPEGVGAWQALLVMAGIYVCFMTFAAWLVKVPADDWKPAGYVPKVTTAAPVKVAVDTAWRTPQFWLLWGVLCLNTTAGIGILGQASPMIQDMFNVTPAAAAGFVGLLSLCNLGGRFLWSSFSDVIGRRGVYAAYFILGAALYLCVPWTQRGGYLAVFVILTGAIISMYGGGFSTLPAYLRDMFGAYQVGAITGRVLTAWSVAAILGPQLVDRLSAAQRAAGVPAGEAYNTTLYLMAGLLLLGLACNLAVRPVDPRHHVKP
ncbi:MAG: OFA family MFS transporter [Opitutaceae bacterium]|nr:OFA family MFS transporter [Opitutaceae bacterium]